MSSSPSSAGAMTPPPEPLRGRPGPSMTGLLLVEINLHLANGASHPWLIPGDSFDEGIDLDSVLPAIEIVIAWISIILLRRLGRERPAGTPANPGAS